MILLILAHVRELMVIYIVTKIGKDCNNIMVVRVLTN